MGELRVCTPCGVGKVWGIGPGVVLVEFESGFVLSFLPGEVKPYE